MKWLIIGIICILLAIGLLVYVYTAVKANTAQEGVMKGHIMTYKPPYENHGLLMGALLGTGMLLFIGGFVAVGLGLRKLHNGV